MSVLTVKEVVQVIISARHGYNNVPEILYFPIDHPFVAKMEDSNGRSWEAFYESMGEDYMESLYKNVYKEIPINTHASVPENHKIVRIFMYTA